MSSIVENTIDYIHNLLDIVKNTSTSTHYYKLLHFLDTREVFNCMLTLQTIATNLKNILELLENHTNVDEVSCATAVTDLSHELLATIKICGTYNLEDLFYLLLDENIANTGIANISSKYILLNQFAHPISFEELPYINYNHLDCIQYTVQCAIVQSASEADQDKVQNTSINTILLHKAFNFQVHCIKLVIHDHGKTFLITCFIDDIHLEIVKNDYITSKLNNLSANASEVGSNASEVGSNANEVGSTAVGSTTPIQWYDYLQTPLFLTYKSCLTLKDLLIYSELDIHNNYLSFISHITRISEKPIGQVVDEFIYQDLYHKRAYLLHLLINTADQEAQYLAYLLYDLLSNDLQGNIDTLDQALLFDSFPFKVKQFFHSAMRETVNYTKKLSYTDLNNIPLEQRICLLKAPDTVKEKAMVKLKEIKAKGDDSGSKPRHYLEGLLKIPFKVLKEEPILRINSECIQLFTRLMHMQNILNMVPKKPIYNSIEVQQYIHILKTEGMHTLQADLYNRFALIINTASRKVLIELIKNINSEVKTVIKIKTLNKKIHDLRTEILKWTKICTEQDGISLFTRLFGSLSPELHQHLISLEKTTQGILTIDQKLSERQRSLH